MIYTQKQGTTQMRQLQQKQPFHFTFHFNLACISVNMSKYNIFIVLIVCVIFLCYCTHLLCLQLNFWDEEGKNKRRTYFQRIKQKEKSSRYLPSLSLVYLIRQRPYGPKTINNGTVHRLIPQAKMCAFFFSFFLVFFFIVLSVSMSFFFITKLLCAPAYKYT